MVILSVTAYGALLTAVAATMMAVRGAHHLYWVSAIATYIFSFLAGFSIGQFTVGLTFVFLTLAVGYTWGAKRAQCHGAVMVGAGLIIGFLMVALLGSRLFLPLLYFFD